MIIRNVKPSDYALLLPAIDRWWTDRDPPDLLHPIFVRQFSDTGFVAEEGGRIIGFLLGLISQTDPQEGLVHLVTCDPSCRQQGVASALYGAFAARAGQLGCARLVVTMSPRNREAVRFHQRLGFRFCYEHADAPESTGTIPVITGYAGPGQDRVIMTRDISSA